MSVVWAGVPTWVFRFKMLIYLHKLKGLSIQMKILAIHRIVLNKNFIRYIFTNRLELSGQW